MDRKASPCLLSSEINHRRQLHDPHLHKLGWLHREGCPDSDCRLLQFRMQRNRDRSRSENADDLLNPWNSYQLSTTQSNVQLPFSDDGAPEWCLVLLVRRDASEPTVRWSLRHWFDSGSTPVISEMPISTTLDLKQLFFTRRSIDYDSRSPLLFNVRAVSFARTSCVYEQDMKFRAWTPVT